MTAVLDRLFLQTAWEIFFPPDSGQVLYGCMEENVSGPVTSLNCCWCRPQEIAHSICRSRLRKQSDDFVSDRAVTSPGRRFLRNHLFFSFLFSAVSRWWSWYIIPVQAAPTAHWVIPPGAHIRLQRSDHKRTAGSSAVYTCRFECVSRKQISHVVAFGAKVL